jgi:hypothetical protein
MWSYLRRWLWWAFVVLAGGFVIAYATDWCVYHLSGSPTSSVVVSRYLSVPLKGNKEEFDFLGSSTVPCSLSLFPQNDKDPCWLLRRNPNKWESP